MSSPSIMIPDELMPFQRSFSHGPAEERWQEDIQIGGTGPESPHRGKCHVWLAGELQDKKPGNKEETKMVKPEGHIKICTVAETFPTSSQQ